jgi:hypothetical protein
MADLHTRADDLHLPVSRPASVTADAFEQCFSETLRHTLDLAS